MLFHTFRQHYCQQIIHYKMTAFQGKTFRDEFGLDLMAVYNPTKEKAATASSIVFTRFLRPGAGSCPGPENGDGG